VDRSNRFASPFVVRQTPFDAFPEIDIPVVAITMSCGSLGTKKMTDRITTPIGRNISEAH
jgi:multidrug efflux pump subunit AcrB